MGQHRKVTVAKGPHTPIAWKFADAAARASFSPTAGVPATLGNLTADDVDRLGLQVDDGSLWVLTALTPAWLQVGGSASGAAGKPPVRAATTANVTLSGAQTIDGVAVIAGDRVLVKDQSTGSQNGIYVAASGAWTRSTDFDTSIEINSGTIVAVSEGTTNGDRIALLTTNDPITLGSTALTFSMVRLPPLTTTAPVNATKAAAAVGTSTEAARADHKHDVSTASAGAVSIGDASSEGSATTLARSDHTHAVAAGTPVGVGTANAAGSAATFARSDHVHDHGAQTSGSLHAAATTSVAGFLSAADKTKLDGVSSGAAALTAAAPSNVTKATAAVGVATDAARADHKHDVSTAAPVAGAVAAGNAAAEGSATSLARSDHQHAVATAAPSAGAVAVGNSAADGAATTFSRSDHQHAVAVGTPVAVGAANAAGAATTFVRSDHVHDHGSQTSGTHHAAATTSVAGFMSAADKALFDGLVTAIKQPVRAATTANITLSGAQTIDGVSVIAGDRVLVKDQSTGSQNGIYVCAAGAWSRATDFDADAEVRGNCIVRVSEGTVNGDRSGILTTNDPIVIGTTALTFSFTAVPQLTSTAPADVTKAAASAGVSTEAARADHKHDVTTAAPVAGAVAIGNSASEGTATTLARSDHQHAVSAGTPVTVGTANAAGAAATFARSDHVHDHGAQTSGTLHAAATTSVAGFMSAADKANFDGIVTAIKQPVRAATTANITLSGAQTIDGVSVIAGDRVLVKDQSTGSQNGIYVCAAGAWSRAVDFDADSEVRGNCIVRVSEGTVNGDRSGILTTNDPIVIGTTALTFSFTAVPQLTSTAPTDVTKAAASAGVSTEAARADHKHDVTAAAPAAGAVAVGNAAAEGSATTLSRSDHTHAVTAAAPVTIGTANAAGAATSFVRSDHVHDHGAQTTGSHHAVVTSSVNGFMSAADKVNFDSTVTAVKQPVRAASTANLTLSAPQTIDGVAVIAGDRVLAKDQVSSAQNGIYVVAAGAWTRAVDFDADAEVRGGTMVRISEGTVNGDRAAVLTTNDPITVGSTLLTFSMTALASLTVTAPADVTKAAASVGTSTDAARADHKHDVTTAAPAAGAVAVGNSAAEGTATTLARSDHQHAVSAGTPVTVGTANAAGSAATFVRSDHVHDHGAQTSGTHHAAATTSVAGFMSAADKTKFDNIPLQRNWYSAAELVSPVNSNWTVNAFAPLSADSVNAGLSVRRFDDTTQEGVSWAETIPLGATNLTLYFKSRAQTAPGGTVAVVPALYRRTIGDNSAVGAWSAATNISSLSIPNNTNYQYATRTLTLSSLSLTAGTFVQYELTRVGTNGSDTLTGDWVLLELGVEYT